MRASEPAGFAFRQPLARDLHRAVTHRTHLFVLLSLSLALAITMRERRRPSSLTERGPPPVLRQTPFTVATRLVDPSFGAYPSVSRFRSLVPARVNSRF